MATFDSSLNQTAVGTNNPHAIPTPVDVAAAVRLLQDQFSMLAQDAPSDDNREVLMSLFRALEGDVEHPPEKVAGVSQEMLDQLDRVPKTKLKDDSCPICAEKYMDDPYPLVVQLQCHHSHKYDLACVGPWLRIKGTCPLCRTDLTKYDPVRKAESERIKRLMAQPEAEEDEEDENFLYG